MRENGGMVNPGYYTLKSCVIQSAVGVRSVEFNVDALNIAGIITSIAITTSIDQTSLVGSFTVIDTIGLLESFPLRGEERAQIVLEDSFKTEILFDVLCYKIDDVTTSKDNNRLSYTVHFVSYQSFFANRTEIIKSYREKTITDMVVDIFNTHFNPRRSARPSDRTFTTNERVSETANKDIIIYPGSDGLTRCIIPRLKPDQAMSFLAKRAYSELSRSSSYRFFENNIAYYFTTDDALYDVAEQRNRIFKFTFYPNIQKTPDNFQAFMNNLFALSNSKRVNSIDDMFNGAYRNKIYVLDILKRNMNLNSKGYNYFESKGLYFGTEDENVDDRHTVEFFNEFFNENVQKRFLLVKDYMDEDTNSDAALSGNMYLDEIGSNRIAFKKHIESITVDAIGPGRFDVSAGDIIDLEVPELQSNTSNRLPEKNQQLSGKYIVKSVTHAMGAKEEMTNHYTLIKREWSRVRDDNRNLGLRNLVNEIERGI